MNRVIGSFLRKHQLINKNGDGEFFFVFATAQSDTKNRVFNQLVMENKSGKATFKILFQVSSF